MLQSSMILNNFGAIILRRKQLKHIFKIFVKQFQQELAFIQEMISNDAEEIKKQANCCYCVFKRLICFGNKLISRFEMYNPVFYNAFTTMDPLARQEYFIELLDFMDQLGKFYDEYQQNRQIIEDINIHKYKADLTSNLVDKIISKDILKELQTEEQNHVCIDLLVWIEDARSQKVGRFKNLKFEMIEKVNGEQIRITLNLRNYQVINYDKDRRKVTLFAIYETIAPLEIEIQFTAKNSESQFEKYLLIFLQIVKIGKIQKLISNIDLIKVFGRNYKDEIEKEHENHNSLIKTFVRKEDQQYQSHEKNFVDADDIIKSATLKKEIRVKKLQSIRQEHYQEIKKKLIQTLNFLSDRKEKQNKRVEEFYKRNAISRPKQKSEAIIKVLKSTEAFIPRKKSQQKLNMMDEIPRDILDYALQIEDHKSNLNIINRDHQNARHNAAKSMNDSLYVDSNENKSSTSQKFHQIFNRKDQEKQTIKIEFNRNMYNKLYPQNFKFIHVESLMQMIKVSFNDIYVVSQQSMVKESNNLSDDKLAKFKISWLEKLTNSVRIYCRKHSPSFMKIFIPFSIEIRALVQAVVNVEAYRYWHPNIKKVQIVTAITSQNIIIYRMTILNPITNKTYTILMLMHLFRLEGKYYIIQKQIEDSSASNQMDDKGLLQLFSFNKSSNCFSKISFLMFRISNLNKNGVCQMVISFDYEPIYAKYAENARKELMTFFLNFVFIINYWKLSQEERQANPAVFNFDWIVSYHSFDHEEKSMRKQPLNDCFDDSLSNSKKVAQERYKQNVDSSSELIHSSEFYDM